MKGLFAALFLLTSVQLAAAEDQVPEAPRQVLIIGDEMAGGMGAGLTRISAESGTLQIINRFSEGSGLSRPELYDWAAAIPKISEGKNFAAAIMLLGLNDRRDIHDGDTAIKFGTPEWDDKYKSRIDTVIDALAAQHMQILWMGEPPMGEPAFDADMQNLTALIQDRATAKGVVFVDLRAPFLNAQGGYTDRGPDETGADRRLRENDGITFYKQGNNRLGQIALAALQNLTMPAPSAPEVPGVANIPLVPTTPVPKPEASGPIFGQQGDEDPNAQVGNKRLAAEVALDRVAKAANALSTIGIGGVKGSNAEALFTTGLAPPPPPGRFDDFKLPNSP